MQDSLLSKKAEEIQSFADRKDMKKFHGALKSSGTTLMTDKDAVCQRWAGDIVCAQSTINDNTNILPLVECNVLLDEFQTVTETTNTETYRCSTACEGRRSSHKTSRTQP